MTIATGQVTLNTTTAVQIVPARAGRKFLIICSHGAFAFVGDSTVSKTTGAMLADRRGDQMLLLQVTDAVYGINLDVDGHPVSFIEAF